jgi:hypothetical protein
MSGLSSHFFFVVEYVVAVNYRLPFHNHHTCAKMPDELTRPCVGRTRMHFVCALLTGNAFLVAEETEYDGAPGRGGGGGIIPHYRLVLYLE